jgi:hypothetical protein
MEARLEAFSREETQRVSDVDDCVTGTRFDPQPSLVLLNGTQELKPPLRSEQEGERSDVCVLVVARVFTVDVLWVVKKNERRCRRLFVSMVVFETSRTLELESMRKTL